MSQGDGMDMKKGGGAIARPAFPLLTHPHRPPGLLLLARGGGGWGPGSRGTSSFEKRPRGRPA